MNKETEGLNSSVSSLVFETMDTRSRARCHTGREQIINHTLSSAQHIRVVRTSQLARHDLSCEIQHIHTTFEELAFSHEGDAKWETATSR